MPVSFVAYPPTLTDKGCGPCAASQATSIYEVRFSGSGVRCNRWVEGLLL